jgi:quinol monooxygenase YgiN
MEIAWRVELAVKPGQLDDFEKLTGEMVASALNECGVLSYQRFVSENEAQVHVYERYSSSAAALAHLENFKTRFATRFEAMVTRRQFTVFGQPDQALKVVLDRFGAVYLRPFGDFQYWA